MKISKVKDENKVKIFQNCVFSSYKYNESTRGIWTVCSFIHDVKRLITVQFLFYE